MKTTPKPKIVLTKEQRAIVKSLIEDSGYTRADAIQIVLAGGLE